LFFGFNWRTAKAETITGHIAITTYDQISTVALKQVSTTLDLLNAGKCHAFDYRSPSLVEEPNNLASNVFPTGLLVVHNTSAGGQDDISELTSG